MTKFFFSLILLIAYANVAYANVSSELSVLRKSVFKIRTTSVAPDFRRPWKHFAAQSSYGSGFYIGDGKILTNAHVVSNQRFVTVQKDGDPTPQQARVLFAADDVDLALLTVEDPSYFKNLSKMQFGPLPKLLSPVECVGYPRGGEQISITEGVVSRISYRAYAHATYYEHLLVQVDSAINPGNSGGPVLQYGKVVGVAFQGFSDAQSTGYIIPVPVIQRFLADIKDGQYDGTPIDGLTTQDWALISPTARQFFGVPGQNSGSFISHVGHSSFLKDHLKMNDVLINLDNNEVGIDDKINWRGERVDFRVLIDLKLPGESLKASVVRDRKIMNLTIPVTKNPIHYESARKFERFPKFYTYGGLVFSTLSLNLLQSWGQRWFYDSPTPLRYIHTYAPLQPLPGIVEDVVVLLGRMPNAVNSYVQTPLYSIVKSVNNQPVTDLAKLKELISQSQDEYINIDYYYWETPSLLRKADADKAQADIVKTYQIHPEEFLGQEL